VSEELLPYYNRELSFIRRLAGEFAAAHPKIAARLQLGPESSADPHVERLIEAFAYLSARIRHKLDDDFPEITDALLQVLYPHYLAPIPSMAIVQFGLDPGQSEITAGHTLPAKSMLESEPIQGEPCRFQTCYPVTLWPVDLKTASLSRPPFVAPATPRSTQASSVVRLLLRCRADTMNFGSLELDSLRFFLKGQGQHVGALYEMLFNDTLEIALARSARDPNPILLDRRAVRPVGFAPDEGLLPYSPRSFRGYGLLTEYFTFPEKFLFFDLAGWERRQLSDFGNQLEIYIFLNRWSADLQQNLSADMFRLGCAPVVNLFSQRAEPIQLSHTDWEYRVVPDARRPLAMEIHSVERVTGTSTAGEKVEFLPFFSVKHAADRGAQEAFWYATRRPAGQSEGHVDHGTEVYLSFVDLGFRPSVPANWTVDIETTCLNRDLPFRLPFGGGQPRLQLGEGGAMVTNIECLTHPTPTLRPARKHGALWKLISHLSLNHLSITDQGEGATALREILKLYDFTDSEETRSMIDGVLAVSSRRVVGRADNAVGGGFCRGVEVTVQLDPLRFAGSGVFLCAAVLERFLGLYCSINSFTRLIATVKGREGELRRWNPRAGEKVLL
jgi:type VI secretion system protein ImpG